MWHGYIKRAAVAAPEVTDARREGADGLIASRMRFIMETILPSFGERLERADGRD
jgi:hypothetical protein